MAANPPASRLPLLTPAARTSYMHFVADSAIVTCIQLAVPEPANGRRTSCRGRTAGPRW